MWLSHRERVPLSDTTVFTPRFVNLKHPRCQPLYFEVPTTTLSRQQHLLFWVLPDSQITQESFRTTTSSHRRLLQPLPFSLCHKFCSKVSSSFNYYLSTFSGAGLPTVRRCTAPKLRNVHKRFRSFRLRGPWTTDSNFVGLLSPGSLSRLRERKVREGENILTPLKVSKRQKFFCRGTVVLETLDVRLPRHPSSY